MSAEVVVVHHLEYTGPLLPDTSWVIAFKEPPVASGDMGRMNEAIIAWCKKEGVRVPLILWGATAVVVPMRQP